MDTTPSAHLFTLVLLAVLGLAPPAWAQQAPAASGTQEQPLAASGELALDDTVETSVAPGDRFRVTPVRVEVGPDVDGELDEEVWLQAAVIDSFVQQEPAEGEAATERTIVRMVYDERALYVGVTAYDSNPEGVIATEMRRDSPRILDEDNFQLIFDTFRDFRSGYMFVTSPLGAKLEQQISEEGEGGRRGNSSNINRDWDGVWHVSARRTREGWVAEIMIPLVTLRFPKQTTQVWGVNFMRNIRQKNEQVFWAPIPKAYELTRVSLAGTMTGLENVSQGMDLRITPYVLGGGQQVRTDRRLAGSGIGDAGLDVKYGVTSGLNLDVTVNTDFAQVEVDEQQVNLTRFALFFPEKRDFFLENSGMFSVKNEGGTGRLVDLFFTRRIGLSAAGTPIPIFGGARLTGKVDRNNIAVLNIQTQEAFGQQGDNFFVGRYSRDILARSKVGGIVINKETIGSSQYNRTFAADTSLALHRFFALTGFIAKTESPGVSNQQMAGHVNGLWRSPSWRLYSEYTDIQDNFNAEVGFVPRIGIRRSKAHVEWDPRPGTWGIRQMDPMWNIEYTTDQNNRLLTRRIHNMIGVYFEDGSNVIVWYNDHFEQLDLPFEVSPGVIIPAGAYTFGEPRIMYSSDPSQRVYGRASYSPQQFFDGDRLDYGGTLGFRATNSLALETIFSRSDVTLPGGAFVADLASLRIDYALSPEMTLRTLTQYNSTTDSVTTSIRFNWIYMPGSDLYIAYDELRSDDLLTLDPRLRQSRRVPWIQNRQLAIKMTYLLSR